MNTLDEALAILRDYKMRPNCGEYGVTTGWLERVNRVLDSASLAEKPFAKIQQDVADFMVKAGQDCPSKPTMPSASVRELRIKLIAEELLELADAFDCNLRLFGNDVEVVSQNSTNTIAAYDAIIDLLVVVTGVAVAMGLEIQPGWDEVHRSNMSKFIDGHRREDGKWVKGPSYSPANLVPIFEEQAK